MGQQRNQRQHRQHREVFAHSTRRERKPGSSGVSGFQPRRNQYCAAVAAELRSLAYGLIETDFEFSG